MRTDLGTATTRRFFEALYALKKMGILHGKGTFTRRYNISRWNLNALESGKGHVVCINIPCLVYLVRDYAVSAHWLLTGEGPMFDGRFDAFTIKTLQDGELCKNGAGLLLKEKKPKGATKAKA